MNDSKDVATDSVKKPTTEVLARKAHHAFSEKLVSEILMRVADGESINYICSATNMPSRSTFFDWVAKDDSVKTRYELAIEIRAEFYAEEIIQIADETTGDSYTDENGRVHVDYENIARSKLRIDARKWYASKMNPKKYGDKTVIETPKDGLLQTNFVALNTDWDAFEAKLLSRMP